MAPTIYANPSAMRIYTSALGTGHLNHAYFIYGEPLCGKKTFARLFAQAILCGKKGEPCTGCPSCTRFQSGNHPDYVEIGGGETGKNSFHADAVRSIRKEAYIKPNDGPYRVFLLCDIDAMTTTAANALLKILEEPPASAVFLLTCSNKNSVPSTIFSRCVPVPMFPTDAETCKKALEERLPAHPTEELLQAAQLADYNFGKALRILSDSRSKELGDAAFSLLQAIGSRDAFQVMAALAPLEDKKPDVYTTLDYLEPLFMRAIRCKAGSGEESDIIRKLASSVTTKKLMALIELTGNIRTKLDQNANLRLTLTWFSSGIGAIIRK